MNRYIWWGIDTHGKTRKGVTLATSEGDLKELLFKEEIALLKCKKKMQTVWHNLSPFSKKPNMAQKAFFFEQLSILINNKIELLKALILVEKQIKDKSFKHIVLDIINSVKNGESLAKALNRHKTIFSNSTIQVINSGANAGKLGFVLESLTHFLNERLNLYKKLKQAALMPILTLSFALFIVWGIFIFVIPQFESLFDSIGKQVPAATRIVIQISLFLRSEKALLALFGIVLFLIVIKIILNQNLIKKAKDKLKLKLFLIGKIFLLYDLISFLHILSMLLKSGINLKDALESSIQTIKNNHFKEKVLALTKNITHGQSLQNSLKLIGEKFFPNNIIAIIGIGEQTGKLDNMLEKAAIILQKNLDHKLYVITTFFQPILLIIIGFLVLFLLLSVYLPIFSMASLV